jgi:hypothetical protein
VEILHITSYCYILYCKNTTSTSDAGGVVAIENVGNNEHELTLVNDVLKEMLSI